MKRTGILLCLGLSLLGARLGWVWLARKDAHSRMEQTSANRERAGKSAAIPADDGSVRITQFYARSGEMIAGDSNVICYGTSNADSVRVEPPVENLSPALTRCFYIDPQQDTTYTLVALGAGGKQVTESFRVRVKPAPPAILMLATSERQISKGEPFTVCYGVAHTSALRMEPNGWQLPPSAKNCTRFYPGVSATYSLVATGEGGTDRKAFSVTVK